MAEISGGEIHQRLKKAFSQAMRSGGEIAASVVATSLAGHEHDAPWIKENFSRLVEHIQQEVYREYLEAEHAAGGAAIRSVFSDLVDPDASAQDVLDLISGNFFALDRFFLSLTQGRKPRAGSTFEYLIRELFSRLDYPFTQQAIINGQPDFVLPSETHFRNNAMDSIIFTVKRTLRERWRQIISEGTRGLGFFLATIDEKIAVRDLPEMLAARIYVVVPTRIKECREDYKAAANVITFEQFFSYYLDPAMQRWRASKIIE